MYHIVQVQVVAESLDHQTVLGLLARKRDKAVCVSLAPSLQAWAFRLFLVPHMGDAAMDDVKSYLARYVSNL